ncbi:hypothetical protein GXW82_42275 [Streptacidiphilus sp. 4-A2]|nr:hypothetical protein [Streptacidiphilus sp. 4-A2]
MLRILLTRRWVILTLVFAMLIPVMYGLGMWQFHRYQQTTRSDNTTARNLAAARSRWTRSRIQGRPCPTARCTGM